MIKIEWLLVWSEYWIGDSEPESAAKAQAEVERQIAAQEQTAYAAKAELKRNLAKAHIRIRQLKEEADSAFFRGVAVGVKEADELPVSLWTALAELVEAAKKLKPYCEDIVETFDGSPMVWDDDQSDEWNCQRIKDHNSLLESLTALEAVEREAGE